MKSSTYDRELHRRIAARVGAAMNGRTLIWLSEETGIPLNTLGRQMNRGRFSVESLVAIAGVLNCNVGWLIEGPSASKLSRALDNLTDAVEDVRLQAVARANMP